LACVTTSNIVTYPSSIALSVRKGNFECPFSEDYFDVVAIKDWKFFSCDNCLFLFFKHSKNIGFDKI
jgi:hypothetical protein